VKTATNIHDHNDESFYFQLKINGLVLFQSFTLTWQFKNSEPLIILEHGHAAESNLTATLTKMLLALSALDDLKGI
jgi:hypothetical protein